ncbi:hypothetical protein [Hymenobacter volaticus]|uniref:DUF1853 family protein n=1 Tax=Hymenobacter volaticus TaxID=2932254 RepID=A0ABY4GES6_9BACT|nr:hypothetical protein [Hymenobacter volaticus]UOQ69247.1 hypothetical protein MUN86_27730 [Hymenobacter volaticus]
MRSENKLSKDEELNESKTLISNNLLHYLDFDAIDRNTQELFVNKMYHNDVFLRILSKTIIKGTRDDLFYSIFKPLRDGKLLLDVNVENIFRKSPDNFSYLLEFKQTFRSPSNMQEFLVIYSCDNEIFNSIVQSRECVIEAAIGVSDSEWINIDYAINNMYLKGEKTDGGKKKSIKLTPREVIGDELYKRVPIEELNPSSIRAFIFKLPDYHENFVFEFYYEVKNSFNDPYYYWIAENPMYLHSLVFNYENIKDCIGQVSANCIMGNQLYEPVHDRARGIYTIKTDGLIWPGHGALIVWRPRIK